MLNLRDRSLCKNLMLPPAAMLTSPRPDQLECLNMVKHVSEPDYEAFTEGFYLEQWTLGGEIR